MSLEDDERARSMLRVVLDEPAPPAVTSAADVIRLGRRRLLGQRVTAIAGVVVVVAAIGAASLWIASSAADDGSGVRVGDEPTPTTSPTLPGWTRVDAPAIATTTTTTESPPPPGSTTVNLPATSEALPETPRAQCQGTPPAGFGSVDASIRLQAEVEPVFLDAVAAQLGGTPTVATSQWEPASPTTGTPRGYLEVSVPGARGIGSVQLQVVPFAGSPKEAADADVYAYGGCRPPLRLVQDDGSVLQLYETDTANRTRPTRYLHVYQPDGQLYVIAAAGWSSVYDDGVIISGTGELPLTSEQQADIGIRMAALQ